MKKDKKTSQQEFLDRNFITCKKCGYNNFKDRFKSYGKCLGCGEIIDERAYFKATLNKKAHLKLKLNNKPSCTFKNI